MTRTSIAATMLASMLAVLATGAPSPARADWMVGSDLGLSFFSPDEGDGITTIGWGGSQSVLIPIFQPGVRVGFTLGSLASEIGVSSTVQVLSTEDETLRSFQAMVAYQHNFAIEQSTRWFVNAGLGFNLVGDEDDSFSAPVFGGGVGLRQMMGHGRGSLRFEARLDHQNEFEESGFTVFPSANVFGLRVGWELWN